MAPNSSQPQGTAATYGSLSLPTSEAKKTTGWKLYLLAGSFGAIAVAAIFLSFGGQSSQSVETVQDDLSHMYNPNTPQDRRPTNYGQGAWTGSATDPDWQSTPVGWTDPQAFGTHDKYADPVSFGGKWIVHEDKATTQTGLTRKDLNKLSLGHAASDADGSGGDTWRGGYKWASNPEMVDEDGWGPCYPACGYSIRYREVVCIRSDHTVVEDGNCEASKKPVLVRQCYNYSDCHPCWEVGAWSDCSAAKGESAKTRTVSCSMCETHAGDSTIPAPSAITSPLTTIGFHSWMFNTMEKQGVMGGKIKVSLTSFAMLGLTDTDVCIYGGVGICDRTQYEQDSNNGMMEIDTYFCGFDVTYNDDWDGDVTSTRTSDGCSRTRSIEKGYMCETDTSGACPNGGDYGVSAHNGLQRRQKGFNCNVKPLDYQELDLDKWAHNVVTPSVLPLGMNAIGARATKQSGHYFGKYYWQMGPFDAVMDASNPAFQKASQGSVQIGAVLQLDLKGGNKDRDLVNQFMNARQLPGWDDSDGAAAPVDFMALQPSTEDVCINFCESTYEWSIYKESMREKPRQFSCMNGTWYDQQDGSIRTGCRTVTDEAEQTWDRSPMEIQEHNTHMFCGWGIDVVPFRCCRIVEYGTCEDGKGGCYSRGAVDIDTDVDNGDHSSVHPHSYCGLKYQVADESSSSVFSRVEDMVSVPNVMRYQCVNRQFLYECGASPNAENPNWPNEEPCVRPLVVQDGVSVSSDYYPQGRCGLLSESSGFEVNWDENAHASLGMPRRSSYIKCTAENCAWGSGAMIPSDTLGNGPQMDSSGEAQDGGLFHHLIMVDWLDAYGESCGGAALYETNNYRCIDGEELGSTCNQVYCVENCTSTWVCNGWGTCTDNSMERIGTRTQEGYCYARFFEFTPVDGSVIKSNDGQGMIETCDVAPLDTLNSEREECSAGCDLISFQCRQCWCMTFTTAWEENRWTAQQEYDAVIDSTGLSCYNGLIGRGSPKPTELRSCRGRACPGIWTTHKCFSQIRCDAECSHTRQFRDVFCANRYTHLRESEGLCISNPVGSEWELILSMTSRESVFNFDSAYWEEDETLSSSCASGELDRKMHAFNSKKFDQIKMCFGYGFTLGNPGFEQDMGTPQLTSGVNLLDAALLATRTGWQSTSTKSAVEQDLVLYIGGAPHGDRYLGLNGNTVVYRDIEGLQKGLKTTVRFLAKSAQLSELGSLSVIMLGNQATTIDFKDISADTYKTFEFAFVPPSSGRGELRITQTGGQVMLDKVEVTSDGFEMIGFEAGDSATRTLAEFDPTGVNTDVYSPEGFRADMSAWDFGDEWDEILIIEGGSAEDVIDFGSGDLAWYRFKPTVDPFSQPDSVLTSFTVKDLRTSDEALENTVIDNGGSIMCMSASDAHTNAYWAITGKEMEKNTEGKTDDFGCYRWDADETQPAGVYYGNKGFLNYVSDASKFASDASSQKNPALRLFVRKAEAHGSQEETENNCVVYDFGEHVWDDARSLFSAGEILVGDDKEFSGFNSAAFERVYGTTPAPNTCEKGTGADPKEGFNLNIHKWACDETKTAPGQVSEGVEHANTLNGLETYARWGFVTKVSDGMTCDGKVNDPYDGAIGLGLWGLGDDAEDEGAKRMSSGYMNKYASDTGQNVKKSTWVWVTDTTQNPSVEGIVSIDNKDNNKPGYTVLDGTANIFEVADMCKQKCVDLPTCIIGYYVKSGPNVGECWLSSQIANATEVSLSTRCDITRGVECDSFEKKPTLKHVDSNAYVYESHMVLPGYANWKNNNVFSTGTVFQIHDSSDKFAPVIFGPLTVREVISKQFSYGKQTYVYWQESDTNFDTLRSKDVFVHTKTTDDLEMYGMPGKVVGCLYTGTSSEYRHPRSGRTAETLCNELNKKSDECHGYSCWKNPDLLTNGGFEETDGPGTTTVPGWVVLGTDESTSVPAFDVVDTLEPQSMFMAVLGPSPFICDSCVRFLHLLPKTIVQTTVSTIPGRDYVLSFFYSGKICTGTATEDCNNVKKATVSFDTQSTGNKVLELAVNVEGWGGAPTGDDVTRPFRWKHIMTEVTPAYKVSAISFTDTSEANAMSGVLIDEVVMQVAHAGDLGNNEYDNVDHTECASYCTAANMGECDFSVSAVTTETKTFFNSRVDRDWFAQTVCLSADGSRTDARICEMNLLHYAGAILSTHTDGGRQHYYGEDDESVMHIFGGVSDIITQDLCRNCGQDAYGPWNGQDTLFANVNVMVFTYKIEFTTGITSILNLEVTGQYFDGSVFQLLSRAKTVLSMREVNLEIDSGITGTGSEAVIPSPQNFGEDCAGDSECAVIVPGSPNYEDTIFYFEESAGTTLQRKRSNICIRTPVCELLGEGEDFRFDPHTKKEGGSVHQCSDGIRQHLDCTDPDFFTNFEASKCSFYEAVDPAVRYGVKKMSANSAFKFAVKPTQTLTCVPGDEASCTFAFNFGLYEFQQEPEISQSGSSCDVAGEDDEPAYIIEVSRSVGGASPGVGATQVVRLLDANKNVLLEVTPQQALALEEEVEGQTKFIYFWADRYQDKTTSAWYVRFGRDIPSMGNGSPAIQDVTIGGDVILQYEVPQGEDVLDITHASVWSSHASTFEVCSDQFRHGKMPTERSCVDFAHCQCGWHTPIEWQDIYCDSNCGWGHKRRLVYCRMTEHAQNTVNCAENYGHDCIYEFDSYNPHCEIQLFTFSNTASRNKEDLISLRESDGAPTLKYKKKSVQFGTVSGATSVPMQGTQNILNWNKLAAVSVEGAGCGVLFFDSNDNIMAKVVVPKGSERAVLGDFDGVESQSISETWLNDYDDMQCDDADAFGAPFMQNCNCPSGCALSTLFTSALDELEVKEEITYFHKVNLHGLDIVRFRSGLFNEGSCSPSDKMDTEIRCHEKRGCCTTCAYGDWGCGTENCRADGVRGENCAPPFAWSWGKHIKDIIANYDSHEGGGGCDTGCDSVETRSVTCEEQDWTCIEWAADTNNNLNTYYLPKSQLLSYLSLTQTYQTRWGGPQQLVSISGSDGAGKPICKKKKMQATASVDSLKRPSDAKASDPEDLLSKNLCGTLETVDADTLSSNLDSCISKYTTPLNIYQYAEGCPEQCNSDRWSGLYPDWTPQDTPVANAWHLAWGGNQANEGEYVRGGSEQVWIYRRDDPASDQGIKELTWRWMRAQADVCGTHGDICHPVEMMGSADDANIDESCKEGDGTKKHNHDHVKCSFDEWVDYTDAFEHFTTGQVNSCSKSGEVQGKAEVCIRESQCGPWKYCCCQWETPRPFQRCTGCGDVIIYREKGPVEDDPDEDGVWCVKYGSGSSGRDGNKVVVKDCPISHLEQYGSCCPEPEFLHCRHRSCITAERPATAKHCVAFDQCTYEWHVRTSSNVCDTFTKCVADEAWKADSRAFGDASEQKAWCTGGPQRLQEHDGFVTYGLGACWLPDTRRHNPDFVTAFQNSVECECYYGGNSAVGSAVIYNEELDTAQFNSRASSGFCNPVQVDGPTHVTALHVAVGTSSGGASTTLKGAIYTDGGAGQDRSPGHRVAITKEVAASGPKAWVTLPFPQSMKMPKSAEFSNRGTEGVALTGGRYWFCVFTKDATTLWRTDAEAQPDGTAEGEGVGLCQTTDSSPYVPNSASFPPIELACVPANGQFSVYGSVTNMDMSPYRTTFGDCSMFRSCGACSKAGSNDEWSKTHEPCDWVRGNGEEAEEKCMPRSLSFAAGMTQVTCSKPWALGNYMDLDTWSCPENDNEYLPYANLMPPTSSQRQIPATLELCSESCYFANMHWIGWTGSYRNGMDPNVQQYPAVNGKPDIIDSNVSPFFCEAFDFEDGSKCNLFQKPAVLRASGGEAGTCYVNKDNPNPCNFGSTFKWIKNTDGRFYFVPATDGLMEYIEVGPNGPPSCGTGSNVFASSNWMQGADASGMFMPDPALTCDGPVCQRCLAHSLSRSMVIGTLDASSNSASNPQCKLMTAFKKASECTGDTALLECPAGDRIRILSAFYGRQKGSSTCAVSPSVDLVIPEDADMPDCWNDVAQQVQSTCDSSSACSVFADQQFSSNSECTDIFSYVDIRFSCESAAASGLAASDEA